MYFDPHKLCLNDINGLEGGDALYIVSRGATQLEFSGIKVIGRITKVIIFEEFKLNTIGIN